MPMPFASRFNSRLFGTTGLCEIAVFWPRLVDDLVKFRDDRLPFFLVRRKLVFRYTINGVYC